MPAVAVGAGQQEGGCSSMVEPQPSKLMMWVRFPSPAPEKNGHGEGGAATGGSRDASRPHSSAVEHFLGKEEVTGSNPVVGSTVAHGALGFTGRGHGRASEFDYSLMY